MLLSLACASVRLLLLSGNAGRLGQQYMTLSPYINATTSNGYTLTDVQAGFTESGVVAAITMQFAFDADWIASDAWDNMQAIAV